MVKGHALLPYQPDTPSSTDSGPLQLQPPGILCEACNPLCQKDSLTNPTHNFHDGRPIGEAPFTPDLLSFTIEYDEGGYRVYAKTPGHFASHASVQVDSHYQCPSLEFPL